MFRGAHAKHPNANRNEKGETHAHDNQTYKYPKHGVPRWTSSRRVSAGSVVNLR